MKKLFYLIVLMVFSSTAQAQQIPNWHRHFSPELVKKALLQRESYRPQQAALQKTTGTKLRIIAESEYDLQTTPINKIDSSNFKYFGSNGSTYYPSQENYQNYYPPFLSIGGNGDAYTTINPMADSIRYWQYNTDSASFNLINEIAASYTSAGHINTYEDKGSSYYAYHTRYSNTYNNIGQLKQILGLEYDTVAHTWDSSTKYTYTYSAQGKLMRDSLYEWDANEGEWSLYAIIKHSYDANGNEKQTDFTVDAGSSFVSVLRAELTFYPNNQQKTFIFFQNMGSGLAPDTKDTFATQPSGLNYATESWTYYNDNNQWKKYSHRVMIVNNQNMPDSILYDLWNDTTSSYNKNNVTVFTYNSDNLPTQWNSYVFPTSSTTQLQNTHYFYYESFTPSGIEQTKLNTKITLYPNPTNDALHLEWKEGIGKQVNLSITNTAGQLLRSESFTWHQATEIISLQTLAPGNYFIRVSDIQRGAIFSTQFVKK